MSTIILVGWRTLIAIGLSPNDDRLAFAGWALATGALFNGILLLFVGWVFAGELRPISIALTQALLVLGLGLLSRSKSKQIKGQPSANKPLRPSEHVFRAVICLAVLLFILRILVGNLSPALTGDESMLWGLKARAIASANGLGPDYLAFMARPGLRHEDYPLLNPLLQAWVLLLDGGGAILLRLPMQLSSLALLLCLASALKRVAGPLVAAALILAFVASPLTADAVTTAGAEGLVALGLVISVDALGRFERNPQSAWIALSAMGMALAIFTKNEALLFVPVILIGATVRAFTVPCVRPTVRQLGWLLLPVITAAAGAVFNASAGFANDLTSGKNDDSGLLTRLGTQALDYLPTTADFFARELFSNPRYDGLVLFGFGLALFLSGTRALAGEPESRLHLGRALVPAISVSLSLAGLFVIYLATPQPLQWHLDSSALRVSWQLLPLACIGLATLIQGPNARVD